MLIRCLILFSASVFTFLDSKNSYAFRNADAACRVAVETNSQHKGNRSLQLRINLSKNQLITLVGEPNSHTRYAEGEELIQYVYKYKGEKCVINYYMHNDVVVFANVILN